jgi:hypothetical protein
MPAQEQARIWRESLPSIVAAFVVSLFGGGVGTYISFNLLSYRVEQLEKGVADINTYDRVQDERLDVYKSEIRNDLSEIKDNVAYIRGKLENR